MVKERKAQTGATNLSARSDGGNNTSTGPSKFFRSWTHKLVSPDEYVARDPNLDKIRQISNTATWLPLKVPSREFNSTTTTSFRDPRTVPVKQKKVRTIQEIEDDNKRIADQRESITSLCKLATKTYGTTAAMMKSFNKKSTDSIHIDEFGEYLRRNQLEEYLNHQDRQKIFSAVDPKNDGSVQVSALLKTAEEQEFHESEHKKDMLKIRDFLVEHVAKNRADSALPKDAELESIKKKKAIENENELMKIALGTKTFDLDISPAELQNVIKAVFEKFPDDQGHRKFARFLKNSNLNLDIIPFYDMRRDHLDALKHRAATLERTLHSDEIQHRYEELSQTRWRGSLSTTQSHAILPPNSPQKLSTEERDNADAGVMQLSRSLPNLSLSPAKHQPPSARRVLQSIQKPKNLVVQSARGVEIDDGASATMSRASLLDSLNGGSDSLNGSPSAKSLRAARLKEEIFESREPVVSASDFYTQIVDSTASMGRVKDPTKVMRIEKIDTLALNPHGKRTKETGPTDWTRVGFGGHGGESANHLNAEESRFSTTNSEFFTPLIYEPSKPVTRGNVSEAALAVQKRNYRRHERHQRTMANLDVTKTRLEFDLLEKEMRSMRNQHSRAVDSIRYETAMLLNDLQCYKKQPLQRMNRKPNLTLSDKMWGGNQDSQTVKIVPESRDFNTTYNSSFQSSALLK